MNVGSEEMQEITQDMLVDLVEKYKSLELRMNMSKTKPICLQDPNIIIINTRTENGNEYVYLNQQISLGKNNQNGGICKTEGICSRGLPVITYGAQTLTLLKQM